MNKYKRENRILDALVYIIMIATIVMAAPLVYRLAGNYSFGAPAASPEGENPVERPRSRRYTVAETKIDISALQDTRFGALSLVSVRITDCAAVIMLCEASESGAMPSARLAVWNLGEINVFPRSLRSGFAESVRSGEYTYKDYGDGTVFLSNNRSAFLFDFRALEFVEQYTLPADFNIYQAVLSNNRDRLALAAEEGFFVYDVYPPDAPLKELIASSVANNVLITARDPVWSSGDTHIFYKSYADNFVRSVGMTSDSPGSNEILTGLDGTNFKFLDNDIIFYYFSSGTEPHQENLFRCGFFDPFGDRRMLEVMKSQVYYFGISVSPRGTHLAALSHNGNMVRLNVIDTRTKQRIYSGLFEEVYNFSFSPNERNFIMHARYEGEEMLKFIEIDWDEE